MALHVSFYVSNKNKLSILINQLLIVYCLLCCYFIYNLVLIHFFIVRTVLQEETDVFNCRWHGHLKSMSGLHMLLQRSW